ncbi:MAG TPA: 30S ribosomal protein S6 [Gaiella sp.]
MTEYEILLLLDPELAEEKQADVVARLRDLIEKGGGTFERHDVWGRRKLAYPIDKKEDGIYHLLSFASSPETLDELSRVLKIDDDVMRHMATRRPEGGPSEPIAAGAAIGDDAETAPADTLEEE